MLENILVIPFIIASFLLIPVILGVYGWLISMVIGLDDKLSFTIDDDIGLVATGFWLEWRFWVCVLIGACSTYIAIKINQEYNFLYSWGYVLSVFPLMLLRDQLESFYYAYKNYKNKK